MRERHRPAALYRGMCLVAGLTLVTGLVACQSTPGSDAPAGKNKGAWSAPVFPLKVVITPADASPTVPPAQQVIVRASGGKLTSVRVAAATGAPLAGDLSADGTLWTAKTRLAFGTKYAVVADAVDFKDKSQRVLSSFTTAKPSKLAFASVSPLAGETVGVGMPILVTWDRPVTDQAAAEKLFKVTASKPVVGSWYWLSDTQVHYRPRVYWPAYTQVTVDINVEGVHLGNDVYGEKNRHIAFSVGAAVISTISNASKSMTVVKDGKTLRSFPVSLGKASMPTSSGTHVVMEKFKEKFFDSASFGLPRNSADGYYQKVYWDTRFTGGGEFVHAAPWSLADQGRRNVSHGCVNVSPANAEWFYYTSTRGDIVNVVGTERRVRPGDGWTDWNLSWDEYLKGSALA